MSTNPLDLFHPHTARWFARTLGEPTMVQEDAWAAIKAGKHTLACAPTGTGKTLSAFLVYLDEFMAMARAGGLPPELQLIYISPLKSLAADIRENLEHPLQGMLQEEGKEGTPFLDPPIRVAMRTGDTPQNERRKMVKHPPHVLITTPESLYLMLTSASGRSILRTAKAVILDELHALIQSKRGAHLMLSLARLDKLCPKPLQRVGLSATIEPLCVAAEYLSPEPVEVVAPNMVKKRELTVISPFANTMRTFAKDPVWQEVAGAVYAHCMGTRSVIAFVEGRAYTEKLAYFVNQLGGEGFAKTHHGSLSKERRLEAEQDLREGKLRLLCATSSMELGIDVGEIDKVFQIGCPRTLSSTMQRLGRAGHNPNRTSVMYLFPRTASEGLYCGITAKLVKDGEMERSLPPRMCLDVLAQHLVSMAAGGGYALDDVMELLPRAHPFRQVTKDDVRDVLCMLAGDYEHERDLPVRPRLLYDRIHERVEGDPYSRMLAVSAGGTIPDRGMYALKTEQGVKIGELEEEFVYETRIGDRFLLGTFAWQIVALQRDAVVVKATFAQGARVPFWKGDMAGRGLQTGMGFGRVLRALYEARERGELLKELHSLGLDEKAALDAEDLLERQIADTHFLPDDGTIIVEHFHDEGNGHQMMVHSQFGLRVNAPFALLAREAAKKRLKLDVHCVQEEGGFLLYSYDGCKMPEGLLYDLDPEMSVPVLEAVLPTTAVFNMTFRYNAGRALMMGVQKFGRQPLWIQRMRGAKMMESLLAYEKHPLVRETKRECLEDVWDVNGLAYVLNAIRAGSIRIYEMSHHTPSPLSLPLQWKLEAAMMYDYAPSTSGARHAVEEALKQTDLLVPEREALEEASKRRRLPSDEKQLHALLMMEGDVVAGELAVPVEWFESLVEKERARYIEPGLWIAAEQEGEYAAFLAFTADDAEVPREALRVVRRLLRFRGAKSLEQVGERYLLSGEAALRVLTPLKEKEEVVEWEGLYYHADVYGQARKKTVWNRRKRMKTLPPERYAALLASRTQTALPAEEALAKALESLCGQAQPVEYWEGVLLPSRVAGYRPAYLDALLARGEFFWRMPSPSQLSFHLRDDVDWEADPPDGGQGLDGDEKTLWEALGRRGASFMNALIPLLNGASPREALLGLVEKGLAFADSFLPVRLWLEREKWDKIPIKRRVQTQLKLSSAGRWELARPLRERSAEQILEEAFGREVLLCRETLQAWGLPWANALEILRIWEYTGKVRRGYFIAGLSGAQFILDTDFASAMAAWERPDEGVVWMAAVDPAQPWGKTLPHDKDRAFLNVSGTVVALRAGLPIAVWEQHGKQLRVFDEAYQREAVQSFARCYQGRRLFPTKKRISVKRYPKSAAEDLSRAGFLKEMGDYVLYQTTR